MTDIVTSPDQYKWEFVDPPDSEFNCSICREVLREPNLTSCCGNHFCQACIEPLICSKRPCSRCGSEAFTTILDKSVRRKIFALDVRCPMWRRGCRWTGKLGNLAVHLDGENGDCQYVDVKCTRCGGRVQRCELLGHLEQFCPKPIPEQHGTSHMTEILEILRRKDQQTQKELQQQKEMLEGEIQQIQERITKLETTFAEEIDMLKQRGSSLEIRGVRQLDPPTAEDVLHSFHEFKTLKERNRDFIFCTQRGRRMRMNMTSNPSQTVLVSVSSIEQTHDASEEKNCVTVLLTDPTGQEPPYSKTKYGSFVSWTAFISFAEMEKYAKNNVVHISVCVKEAD